MRFHRLGAALLTAAFFSATAAPAAAAIIDIIKIGTWIAAPGSGNDPTAPTNGPGLVTGQRYVLKIEYDDTSTVTTVSVPDDSFTPTAAQMDVIALTGGSNTLEVLVPMEGKDSGGTPFVYQQTEADHFWYGPNSPTATLNFTQGSSVSNPANIIGVEFEGDFDPSHAANQNIVEIWNSSPDGVTINQSSQILNCADAGCASSSVAMKAVNALTDAVAPTVNAGPDRVYNAATLTVDTLAVGSGNDLGNARSDGEDFLDFTWTENGGALIGTPAGDPGGNNLSVGIADSGLTDTTSTAVWTVVMNEQLTGLGGVADSLNVSYDNAGPSASASAAGVVGGTNFDIAFDDPDLVVNSLIGGFETLITELLVDAALTSFFDGIFNAGSSFFSNAALLAEFGAGAHNALLTVTDLAGETATATFSFLVPESDGPHPAPAPATPALLLLALTILATGRRRFAKSKGDNAHV